MKDGVKVNPRLPPFRNTPMNYGKFSAVFLLLGAVAVGGYALLAQAGAVPRPANAGDTPSTSHHESDHDEKGED
jgi:hypothetical protein